MMPRRLHVLLAVAAVVALLGACGVPTDSEPMKIPQEAQAEIDNLAAELGAPEPAPTPIAVNFPNDGINVYFIGQENRLVAVNRNVESDTASAVLQSLLEGPTEAEREELGYSTAIDVELQVLGVDTLNATVIVDVASGSTLEALTGDEAKLAFAQMVYTLTELTPIASFQLKIDGERTGLPTDAGLNNPEEAVLRTNYLGCCAPPIEPTPTPIGTRVPVRSTATPLPATPTPDSRPTPTVGAATPVPTTDG